MYQTNEVIMEMISRNPMTKRQIADKLRLSPKTVGNRLGEIHKATTGRNNTRRMAFFDTGNRSQGYYALVSLPGPVRKMIRGRHFKRNNNRNTLEGGVYPTIVYNT
jgi:hypothetical protein